MATSVVADKSQPPSFVFEKVSDIKSYVPCGIWKMMAQEPTRWESELRPLKPLEMFES
jgi:hypothetical protein